MANTKITSRVIADNAVTTAAIADDAITSAKLDTNIAVAGTLTVTGDANFDSGTLFVDASANYVGIGTSSPASYTLAPNLVVDAGTDGGVTIKSGTSNYGGLFFADGTSGNQQYRGFVQYNHNYVGTTDSLLFGTAGAERMRINSYGNVAIGTNDADIEGIGSNYKQLTISSPTTLYPGMITFQTPSSASGSAEIARVHYLNGTTRAAQFLVKPDGATNSAFMAWATANAGTLAERLRITGAGHVLINTTSLQGVGGLSLQVGGNHVAIENNTTSSAGNGTEYQVFRRNSSQIGSITMNGTTAVQYNTSSDYRLKENVVTEWDATTRLKQLKPSRFNFITEPDRTVDGFLAHEVQDIVPEAIAGEKDAVDAEGNPKYQGIDQSKLVPLLTKALQEQQTIIDDLKSRIETLEG